MNWDRIKCAVFGHRWKVDDGHISSDIGAPTTCTRCNERYAGIDWSRAPQMPECKPPREEGSCAKCGHKPRTHEQVLSWGISIPPMPCRHGDECGMKAQPASAKIETVSPKVSIEGLEEAKAEVAALHAQWSEVIAMQKAAERAQAGAADEPTQDKREAENAPPAGS